MVTWERVNPGREDAKVGPFTIRVFTLSNRAPLTKGAWDVVTGSRAGYHVIAEMPDDCPGLPDGDAAKAAAVAALRAILAEAGEALGEP